MNNSVFRIDLDIHRQTTQEHLAVNKGDTARQIVASLSDGGRLYIIDDGCYAVFKAKKPDGNVLYNDCTIDNNRIVYEFTEQTASAAGRMLCELQLYGSDDKLITSPKIAIIVNGNVYEDSEVESSSEFTALAQAMTDLAELKANGLKGDKGDTGPVGPQGPQGESDVYYIGIEAPAGNEIFEDYNSIRQEYESGRTLAVRLETEEQENVILPLVKDNNGGIFHFAGVCDGVEWLVTISEDAEAENGTAVTVESRQVRPLEVQISSDGITADKTFAEILAAHEAGRPVSCHFQTYVLPLMAVSSAGVIFQSVANQNFVRVAIKPDGSVTYSSGKYALVTDLEKYALAEDTESAINDKQDKNPETEEKYFGITDDGTIYLKGEYRGAAPNTVTAALFAKYVISDNGVGVCGSMNAELPADIVIPEFIGETPVNAVINGMFVGNPAVQTVTIPTGIKEIPSMFAASTMNLREVDGTENVTKIGSSAFQASGITKALFPNLKTLGNNVFAGCELLRVADLGAELTSIPKYTFQNCECFHTLRGAGNVTTVEQYAFTRTRRLKTPSFVANLKSIGAHAFPRSRVTYDWATLSDCTFGEYATALQWNPVDFWTGAVSTQCSIPLRSSFSQVDPRWADDEIVPGGLTWYDGCTMTCGAVIYSAYEDKELETPAEFVEAAIEKDPSLLDLIVGHSGTVDRYLQACGYTVENIELSDAAGLQELYDTLAAGNLVILPVIASGDPGQENASHVVVAYGVNGNGELLIVDSNNPESAFGVYRASTYAGVVQNMTRKGWGCLVAKKGA